MAKPWWLYAVGPLYWRHNGRDRVSNHQPLDCLLNCLFRHRSKKTSKLRVTGLCGGNSPVTGEFPAQRASDAGNVSIRWRHHATRRQGPTHSGGRNEVHLLSVYVVAMICCLSAKNWYCRQPLLTHWSLADAAVILRIIFSINFIVAHKNIDVVKRVLNHGEFNYWDFWPHKLSWN